MKFFLTNIFALLLSALVVSSAEALRHKNSGDETSNNAGTKNKRGVRGLHTTVTRARDSLSGTTSYSARKSGGKVTYTGQQTGGTIPNTGTSSPVVIAKGGQVVTPSSGSGIAELNTDQEEELQFIPQSVNIGGLPDQCGGFRTEEEKLACLTERVQLLRERGSQFDVLLNAGCHCVALQEWGMAQMTCAKCQGKFFVMWTIGEVTGIAENELEGDPPANGGGRRRALVLVPKDAKVGKKAAYYGSKNMEIYLEFDHGCICTFDLASQIAICPRVQVCLAQF